jgi:hypothetical protein
MFISTSTSLSQVNLLHMFYSSSSHECNKAIDTTSDVDNLDPTGNAKTKSCCHHLYLQQKHEYVGPPMQTKEPRGPKCFLNVTLSSPQYSFIMCHTHKSPYTGVDLKIARNFPPFGGWSFQQLHIVISSV